MNAKKLRILPGVIAISLLMLPLLFWRERAHSQGPPSSAQRTRKDGSKQLPNLYPFIDSSGAVETYTSDPSGKLDLSGPFFQALGTNGRSCDTCHQASDGWSVSAAHVKERFEATGGTDPIFRTVD